MEEIDVMVCDLNKTGNGSFASLDYSLADTRTVVVGTVVFALILPFVLFDFRFFPIGTTAAVLLGAMLMIVTTVVGQDEAYHIIGEKDNLTTIFLLLGMMLIAQYFEREQLLVRILRRFLKQDLSFQNYIWRISLLSFVLSAFFTNDACCAILTPLLLKYWEVQERPRAELETILLAIATSANIGSVTTVFGNPQMALIAARTDQQVFSSSRLDQRTCLMYLLLPAVLGYFINIGFLVLHYRIKTRRIEKSKLVSEPSRSESEMAGLTENGLHHKAELGMVSPENGFLKNDIEDDILYDPMTEMQTEKLALPPPLETIPEDQVLDISSTRSTGNGDDDDDLEIDLNTSFERHVTTNLTDIDGECDFPNSDTQSDDSPVKQKTSDDLRQVSVEYKLSAFHPPSGGQSSVPSPTAMLDTYGLQLSKKAGVYRSVGAISAAEFLPEDTGMHQLSPIGSVATVFVPSDNIAFQVILCILMVSVIVLFLASNETVKFDIGLVPMGAAILAMTADSLLTRRTSMSVMKRVDWSILMMFFGIFVWMHGLNKTRVPRWLWYRLGLAKTTMTPAGVSILVVFITVGSNVFSNVPLTLIVLEQLEPCQDQLTLVLLLAWVATIAGNLTLFGSVANLIVAQKGMQTLKYRLTFWGYLRYGFFSTIIIILIGIFVIFGLLYIG